MRLNLTHEKKETKQIIKTNPQRKYEKEKENN